MKRLFLLSYFILGIFLFSPRPVFAQVCGGSVQCCNGAMSSVCNAGCSPNPITGECSCGYRQVCNAGTSAGGCAWYYGTCTHEINTCTYVSGSCSVSTPPTCGNGVCGAGETCNSCQSDCGACPAGSWGACGSCSCGSIGTGTDPQCRISDTGTCVWDPGGCTGGGGGPACIPKGGVCTSGGGTACCGGNTCNLSNPSKFGQYGSETCGNCSDPFFVNLGCGPSTNWCGQTYVCGGSTHTCPNTQVAVTPAAPSGMSPANNTVFPTAPLTCNLSCSDDLDCGSHWVEGRMSRNGNGNVNKYKYMYLDAYTDMGIKHDDDDPAVKYLSTFNTLANNASTSFYDTGAKYTNDEGGNFLIPTLSSAMTLFSYRSNDSAFMDVYVDGKKSSTTALNAIDNPPVAFQHPISVATGSDKEFFCNAGACRLRTDPTSSTCVADPNLRQVQLSFKRAGGVRRFGSLDAIIENGTTVEQNAAGRFTYLPSSAWTTATPLPNYSGGSEIQTSTDSTGVKFSTSATNLILVTTLSTNRGEFDLYVDGKFVQTISLLAAATQYKAQIPLTLPPKVTTAGTQQSVKLSWTPGVYTQFEVQAYPQGTSCADAAAFCGLVSRASYQYILSPSATVYTWRVRSINSVCTSAGKPSTPGTWSSFYTFSVNNATDVTSQVFTDVSGIATLVGGVCQMASPGTYIAGGTVTVSKSGVNKTGSVSTTDGSYTVTGVPGGNGYNLSFSPTDTTYSCTCPTGCTYPGVTVPTATNYPFFVSQIESPWYQTTGGDIGALNPGVGVSVNNPIPVTSCLAPGCSAFLSLPLTTGNNSTAGSLVVQNGTQVDLKDQAGTQNDNVSSNSHLVKLPTAFVPKENYDYFYRLYSLGLSPSDDFVGGGKNPASATKPNGNPSNQKTAFYRNGNLTITSPWAVGANESIVIFIDGNFTINSTITVANGGFIAFIVKGNITVDPTVGTPTFCATSNGQVQGAYLADGTISIPTAGSSGVDLKFVGEGTFAAGQGISIKRDFRNGGNGLKNNSCPVSLFIYRPDLVRNVPDRMKVPLTVWKEVGP